MIRLLKSNNSKIIVRFKIHLSISLYYVDVLVMVELYESFVLNQCFNCIFGLTS